MSRDVSTFSLMQLALIVAALPDREVLWTPFERAARDEYDRRITDLEQAAA